MESSEKLYNLLFEVSNEDRHNILTSLQNAKANLTQISNTLNLKLSETRRHLSRLTEAGLAVRNPDGTYTLTNYGEQILNQIENIKFFTENREYFETHNANNVPLEFQGRLGQLSGSTYLDSVISYIHRMEQIIRDAEKEIWLLFDQFPLFLLSLFLDAIERGVNLKIIELSDRAIHSDLEVLAKREQHALERMKITPLVEQETLDNVYLFMIVSEKNGIVSFPTLNGENDYKGFETNEEKPLNWCRDVFRHYWGIASRDILPKSILHHIPENNNTLKSKVIVGRELPEHDVPAIQEALDRYEEVILKGRFNLGTSNIIIKRSVVLRGDGRTNDIPDTKIYKNGWSFPFVNPQLLFSIRGEKIDVTIENIHIENFNGTCIGTITGNSLILRSNRVTLYSGHGRGLTFGKWGDHVVGFVVGETYQEGGFPGGIIIENNYLDFALSYESGGFLSYDGREEKPEYRPDLFNHEAPICVGIKVSSNKGKVIVSNNTVRNMNARGILVCDNRPTSDILIHDNTITSEVFGAYPYNSPMSGVGIFVQSAWSEPVSGSRIEVFNNKIVLDKVNYCGMAVHGPSMYQKAAGKLDDCIVRDNVIELKDGYVGIQVRKTDSTLIENNRISGKAYYGFQVNGTSRRGKIDLSSCENRIIRNDLDDLRIKGPDEYSNVHVVNSFFAGNRNEAHTGHFWLSKNTCRNEIYMKENQTVIDEGKANKVKIIAPHTPLNTFNRV
jgi:predicted transcriptional regulator